MSLTFIDDALLDGAQLPRRRIGEAFDRGDFFAARAVRQHRARIVRHVVDEDGAGAALGAVAAKLGAGQAQLVAQRPRERVLRHDVDAPVLTVHVQRDEPLHRTRRRRLPVQRCRAEQIGGG